MYNIVRVQLVRFIAVVVDAIEINPSSSPDLLLLLIVPMQKVINALLFVHLS